MLVKKNIGFLTQLKKISIFLWHCMRHRIELAIGDSVKSVTQINHVKSFLDKLYSGYSQSPTAQRKLEASTVMVESELFKIGTVLDVRWVASSYRSMNAVWKSYATLYHHSTDSDKSAKHKAVYSGIASTFASKAVCSQSCCHVRCAKSCVRIVPSSPG